MVSVLIPVYNRQDVVEECIRSVLAQSHQEFEILLVDDGSTDNTVAICQTLAQQDSRIRLFTAEHAGVSAARNKGLEEARGDYVFFLDSDDVIHPRLLESLVAGLKDTDAKIAATNVAFVSEANWQKVRAKLQEPSDADKTVYKTHEESLYAIFHGSSPINLLGGVLMDREYIGETRFRTDLFIGEDYYFIYENLIKGSGSVFLNAKRYYARQHASNSSWNWSYDGFWTRFYRRQLVWESEESFGRAENAAIQKRDGFSSFLTCLKRNDLRSEDSQKMRRTVKEYQKVLFPALRPKEKVSFLLAVHTPKLYFLTLRLAGKK